MSNKQLDGINKIIDTSFREVIIFSNGSSNLLRDNGELSTYVDNFFKKRLKFEDIGDYLLSFTYLRIALERDLFPEDIENNLEKSVKGAAEFYLSKLDCFI